MILGNQTVRIDACPPATSTSHYILYIEDRGISYHIYTQIDSYVHQTVVPVEYSVPLVRTVKNRVLHNTPGALRHPSY